MAMGDFHELKLSHDGPKTWFPILSNNYNSNNINKSSSYIEAMNPSDNRQYSNFHQSTSLLSSASQLPMPSSLLPPPLPRLSPSSSSPLSTAPMPAAVMIHHSTHFPHHDHHQQQHEHHQQQHDDQYDQQHDESNSYGDMMMMMIMDEDHDVIGDIIPPRRNHNNNNNNNIVYQQQHQYNHDLLSFNQSLSTSRSATSSTISTHPLYHYEQPIIHPGPRFCHVGVIYESAFYVFGGYDGQNRLNDFLRFSFDLNSDDMEHIPSTLISELKEYVNNDLLSDVSFIVEGEAIKAHKILCLRCPYFRNLLTGEYMESRASEIVIPDISYNTFTQLLEFLYTDNVHITIDTAMNLFQAADRFGIDRLKKLCEQEMLSAINLDSAPYIFYSADRYNAEYLRQRSLSYILKYFDQISRSYAFEEIGRKNIDLGTVIINTL